MSDYDAIIAWVKDAPRPLTRGALATQIWEARGGTKEDWLRRIDALIVGGALERRLWPGATRRVKTDRVFAGTRTVEYALARAVEVARTRAHMARDHAGRAGAVGEATPHTPRYAQPGRVGRVNTW